MKSLLLLLADACLSLEQHCIVKYEEIMTHAAKVFSLLLLLNTTLLVISQGKMIDYIMVRDG